MKRWLKVLISIGLLVLLVGISLLVLQREEQQVQARLVTLADEAAGDQAQGFPRAQGPAFLKFPTDHGPHEDYQTEWWYYTGNLVAAEGQHFGYQLTLFRRALAPPAKRASVSLRGRRTRSTWPTLR